MSSNRSRNIYTLGAKAFVNRRQQCDPFERDPFKVQSYNFRYAERPSFPVAPVQPRIHDFNNANDCQTYFYNYDFPQTNNNVNTRVRKNANLSNDECGLRYSTNFQEYRRRKLVQEIAPSSPNESKILNICNGSSQNSKCGPFHLVMKPTYKQTLKPGNTFANDENRSHLRIHKSVSSPLGDFNTKRNRSLGSGCEININIKSLEDNSLQDHVNIKIETDSLHKNLNLNSLKNQNIFEHNKDQLKRFRSSGTFVIAKDISQCTIKCPESQDVSRKRNSERIKALTAIYSTQVLKKPTTQRIIKSNERLPSLIPVGLNNFDLMKNNFTRSKSLLEKPQPRSNKFFTNNNLNSSTKVWNSLKQPTPCYASVHSLPVKSNRSQLRANVPLQMSSKTKLPINVNINVYADKLKLLKV